MTLPRHTGSVLGATAVAVELPMFLTLFVARDSVSVAAALGLVGLGFYVGVAGLVVAVRQRSSLGIGLSALSLGGLTFVYFVFWALARAFGQG